jgi:hypothetical protein
MQNALCGAGVGGCAFGFACYTTDGGAVYHCTAVCNATTMQGCPMGWSCNPDATVRGTTYGYCVPPGLVWPEA